jgi:hypothetical protein
MIFLHCVMTEPSSSSARSATTIFIVGCFRPSSNSSLGINETSKVISIHSFKLLVCPVSLGLLHCIGLEFILSLQHLIWNIDCLVKINNGHFSILLSFDRHVSEQICSSYVKRNALLTLLGVVSINNQVGSIFFSHLLELILDLNS